MTDLDKLESIARAARELIRQHGEGWTWASFDVGYVHSTPIAEHAETFSPDVVLALIAELRGLKRKMRDLVCGECGCLLDGICDCPGFGR